MENSFIKNASLGENKWWHYVSSIFSVVIVIAIVNFIIRQIVPHIKKIFPKDEFGNNAFTFSLILIIFGLALFIFLNVASRLHGRGKMSFISNGDYFSWKQYFIGFTVWGSLLFISAVIIDYNKIETFINNFNFFQFLVLFLLGFIAIGVQSFFEELVIRGYFLQGMHIYIKNVGLLIVVNAIIFGFLHFGYGLESFLSSWAFGVAFALVTIFQNRIEFVAGAHNANNLIIAILLTDLSEALNEDFSWKIDLINFSVHIISLLVFTGIAYKFFRKQP